MAMAKLNAAGSPRRRAELLRRVYPRVLGKTLGLTRNLADAEDAVQEAVMRALSHWDERGVPESPEAWLVTVAANAHRDKLRRGQRHEALETLAEMSPWVRVAMAEPNVARGWKDELLRLLFACCHPALDSGESAALALSTVMGLSTGEVAAAFVVPGRTMEQRLTRARKRLRERGDVEGTAPEQARERRDAVLQVIYLLFNEGHWSSDDDAPIRAELCRLALGLARSLAELLPDDPEVIGLLALLQLHDARRDARLAADGSAVPLPEQDRSRWDHDAIAAACAALDRAVAAERPGPFQIEAAIAALHCQARSALDTDWTEIAALYALLETFRPTPAVRVNRAFAVARASGPERGLALLDLAEPGAPAASEYPYVHLVRGALLGELERFEDARQCLHRARDAARNAEERRQIERRIDELDALAKEKLS
jgi:RNA polymerase sigma-70 factor (ECF subfamily)